MHRIITTVATTATTMAMTDYLALAVVLASMLAMSIDNVTGALLFGALVGYLAPAITSDVSMTPSTMPTSRSAATEPKLLVTTHLKRQPAAYK